MRRTPALRLLLIDNYDSYTHNLAHLFGEVLGNSSPVVVRADAYKSFSDLTDVLGRFHAVIISPGPGSPHCPQDFLPLPSDTLRQSDIPVLGVCLGHQALCAIYGARVIPAPSGPVHGRLSAVTLQDNCTSELFRGIQSPFQVVRYHSLVVQPSSLPKQITPIAWTCDSTSTEPVLMAVQHHRYPLYGVQFHPESICTQFGRKIAANFVRIAESLRNAEEIPIAIKNPFLPASPPRISETRRSKKIHKLKVITACIPDVQIDPEQLFYTLYGSQPLTFWLDSSSSTKPASSLSRCSSPGITPHTSTNEPRQQDPSFDNESPQMHTSRGRFSIMGGADGPLSEVVTYCVATRSVAVQTGSCKNGTRRKLHEKRTIFDFLSTRLQERYVACPEELPLEMNGGYVGFFGYELKAEVAGVKHHSHKSNLPDAWFIFADRVVIIDHETNAVHLVAIVPAENPSGTEIQSAREWFAKVEEIIRSAPFLRCAMQAGLERMNGGVGMELKDSAGEANNVRDRERFKRLLFYLERPKQEYREDILTCLREISAGESYEVCLTNRLRARVPDEISVDALRIYSALRLLNPAPYSAFLRLSADVAICCSSPERFLRISSDGLAESKPIKGTVKRGGSLQADQHLRDCLANSVKDRSENLMIVDLVRNDLGKTCQIGSVKVPHLMRVESFATVHQLVSTVRGRLSGYTSCVDCIRAAYPMGSMTGAPKVRTLDIIDRIEHSARGVYSGSIGYLSLCGAADLNVVIRTAILNSRDIEVGVGGAIVALSDPEEEYQEVLVKGDAIMQAVTLGLLGTSRYDLDESVCTSESLSSCVRERDQLER